MRALAHARLSLGDTSAAAPYTPRFLSSCGNEADFLGAESFSGMTEEESQDDDCADESDDSNSDALDFDWWCEQFDIEGFSRDIASYLDCCICDYSGYITIAELVLASESDGVELELLHQFLQHKRFKQVYVFRDSAHGGDASISINTRGRREVRMPSRL